MKSSILIFFINNESGEIGRVRHIPINLVDEFRSRKYESLDVCCKVSVTPQGVARYVARPANQSRHPRAGSGSLQVGSGSSWTGRLGPRHLARRPNGTRRLTLEHDRVGAGLMADRGYVPEQPATQCEGTCTRDCNYLISAVVTKPGPPAKESCYHYVALIEYKPQRCQRQ